MKTRIIKTSFSKSMIRKKAPYHVRNLYRYLLTCEHINISGEFELSDEQIQLEMNMGNKDLSEAKQWLHKERVVLFHEGYIKVVSALTHNGYLNSPKNSKAFDSELKQIPTSIRDVFDSLLDTSIDSSIATSSDTNHKSEIKKKGSVRENKKVSPLKAEFDAFLAEFNSKAGKNYQPTLDREEKFAKRRNKYSLADINRAGTALLKSPYHTGKNDNQMWYATPDFLLRNDEQIDKWMNSSVPETKPLKQKMWEGDQSV